MKLHLRWEPRYLGQDPLQVRILISRLDGASSVRRADPKRCVKVVGVQYNSAIKDLFRDLRRYLERAWIQYIGTDLPATCGGSSCWTCSPTARAAGQNPSGNAVSARCHAGSGRWSGALPAGPRRLIEPRVARRAQQR